MTRRRFVAVVALALVTGLFAPLPAGAQAAPKTQQVPSTVWRYPGPGQFTSGMGTWLYVLPQPAAGAGQLPAGGYQYRATFVFDHLRIGTVGVGSGPHGPVAHLELTDLVTKAGPIVAEVPYNWSPGRFYFVYTQLLPAGDVAGWILDWQTAAWTYIGSVRPAVDWGGMVNAGLTSVRWTGASPAACSSYPRTDAYFYPVLGYTGSTYQVGGFESHSVEPGDCPSQTEILANGWVHYRLGADPT